MEQEDIIILDGIIMSHRQTNYKISGLHKHLRNGLTWASRHYGWEQHARVVGPAQLIQSVEAIDDFRKNPGNKYNRRGAAYAVYLISRKQFKTYLANLRQNRDLRRILEIPKNISREFDAILTMGSSHGFRDGPPAFMKIVSDYLDPPTRVRTVPGEQMKRLRILRALQNVAIFLAVVMAHNMHALPEERKKAMMSSLGALQKRRSAERSLRMFSKFLRPRKIQRGFFSQLFG
jgi:hypothetical protein